MCKQVCFDSEGISHFSCRVGQMILELCLLDWRGIKRFFQINVNEYKRRCILIFEVSQSALLAIGSYYQSTFASYIGVISLRYCGGIEADWN